MSNNRHITNVMLVVHNVSKLFSCELHHLEYLLTVTATELFMFLTFETTTQIRLTKKIHQNIVYYPKNQTHVAKPPIIKQQSSRKDSNRTTGRTNTSHMREGFKIVNRYNTHI